MSVANVVGPRNNENRFECPMHTMRGEVSPRKQVAIAARKAGWKQNYPTKSVLYYISEQKLRNFHSQERAHDIAHNK